jgi:DNA-binding NtrC family response regulator
LSVLPIVIPPLRDHPDDVPILAHHFAQRAAVELNRTVTGIAPDAITLLQRYEWPGNVRELQHAVERAVIMSSTPVLGATNFDHVNPSRRRRASDSIVAQPSGPDGVTVPSLNIDEAEWALIQHALKTTGGNRTRAAALLGVTDRTLRNKLSPGGKRPGKPN